MAGSRTPSGRKPATSVSGVVAVGRVTQFGVEVALTSCAYCMNALFTLVLSAWRRQQEFENGIAQVPGGRIAACRAGSRRTRPDQDRPEAGLTITTTCRVSGHEPGAPPRLVGQYGDPKPET